MNAGQEAYERARAARSEHRAQSEQASAALPVYLRVPDVVDEIMARATEPWASFTLGGVELVSVRAGGYVEAMGPTGSGKTSLVAALAIEHARDRGPVAVMSRELPRDEFVARMIGMQADRSWPDVLRGQVELDEMRRRVDGLHRMLIADRRDANPASLISMIELLQREHPGELVLVVVDYVQIFEASRATDQRMRMIDVIAQIDDTLRHYRCVGLLISQMSRAASRAARGGEAVGVDSTDGGAESAAIERAASVTLSIGRSSPEREDGSRAVELSIGKGRMFGGDQVVPMTYWGRSGRWRIAGEARSGAEVKAEKAAKNASKRVEMLHHAIPSMLDASDEPLSRAAVRAKAGANDADTRAAIGELLAAAGSEPLDVVEVGKRERGAYKVWTRRRAVAAGLAIVPQPITTPEASR